MKLLVRSLSRRLIITMGALLLPGCLDVLMAQGAPPPAPAKITPQTSSTSGSGEFIVYGPDLTTRSAFCVLCDDVASSLDRLLRDQGHFSIPIVVVLKGPPDLLRTGPPITTNISQLAQGGFHLQINAQLRADFQSEEFALELVRVLLAERILRNHAELKTSRDRVLPDWVLTGVTQALEFRARSRPSALFAAVFRGGQVFSVDKILAADPAQLDALSRSIYETSACALVLALLDQQDGPVRLSQFLNALALDNKSDRDLLKEHFPTLSASKNSLEKWWSLQMATLATPSPLESISISETEKRLDEALELHFDPLPEKTKGKKGKSADNTPVQTRSIVQASEPDKGPPSLLSMLPLLDLWLAGREIALTTPVPPQNTDAADDSGNATDKKKDAKKSDPKTDKDKDKDKDKKKTAQSKNDDKKPDKTDADKKAAAKKEQEKQAADKKAAEKLEAEKKDLAKKEADKKDQEKKAAAQKKDTEKVPELKAQPHHIDQRPEGVPSSPAAPETEKSKDQPKSPDKKGSEPEQADTGKHSKWNPANWFRGKEPKPDADTAAKNNAPPKSPKPSPKPEARPELTAPTRPNQGTVESFATIWKRPDRSLILQLNLNSLNTLKTQANPLYRPLIAEYAENVRLLMDGKDRGMPDKLAALRERRAKITEKARAVESYLDWYEASETGSYSGVFDDYLKLRDNLDKEIRPRGDAISKYLDLLEKEYEN